VTTISAKVIADSLSGFGARLTTMQLRYPRFIHAEFMTHRAFSRNASSSRATPVARLIQDVVDDPAVPMFWGKNQPGMQAGEEHDALVTIEWDNTFRSNPDGVDSYFEPASREGAWLMALDRAVDAARAFSAAGYHKQVVNRLLEPFTHINVVVTASEWDNFFALRDHPLAEPHIRLLAQEMKNALAQSAPRLIGYGQWHTPYVESHPDSIESAVMSAQISAARCARVSYLTHDGREPSGPDDLKLFDRLLTANPMHASPMEHPATPDYFSKGGPGWHRPEDHGNLVGWISLRKGIEAERRDHLLK
jgi:thymidylate synthase ThyX